MRPGFRQAMTWLHDWAGLVVGWPLLAIAAAGTLSVFRRELDAWAHPELARGPVDQVAAGTAAVAWLARHAPSSPSWFLELADARSPATLAYWWEQGRFVLRALSPVTGGPDGIRDSLGGEFFFRFHFELQLPYPWGRLLAAAAAEMLLVVLLTGIVAHRRIFKDFFTFRSGKGQRSWLDGHVVLGVLALPFHLMIAFTGAVTLLALFMPWGGAAAYRGDTAAFYRDLDPGVERARTERPAPLAPIAPILRAARTRFGADGIASIGVANPGDAAATITLTSGNATGIAVDRHDLVFDGATGRMLAEHVERRPVKRIHDLLYGLHVGRFADLASRWLYFLSGAMLTAAIATGLTLWTSKRRRPHGAGFALVERLNAGFIAGMPAAFAGFLLANRLLPPGMSGRAQWEVRAVFILWGAALLIAAVAPVRRAWLVLSAAAAGLCVATIMADAMPPAALLPGSLAGGGGVAAGVDAMLLAGAVLFGGIGYAVARRPEGA